MIVTNQESEFFALSWLTKPQIAQREGGTQVILVLLQVPEAYSKADRVLLPVDAQPL